MYFRFIVFIVAGLIGLPLATACGEDPGPKPQPAVPTAAEVSEISTSPNPAPPPTPRPGGAHITPKPAHTPVTVPTPLPTTPAPTVTSEPVPTPTIDIAQQIARGKRLVERNNCLGCHSVDGHSYSAPTFKGLFGNIRQLRTGGTVTADGEYLRESIKQPNGKIVQDYFPDSMPKVFFKDVEINAIVEYIKTLD